MLSKLFDWLTCPDKETRARRATQSGRMEAAVVHGCCVRIKNEAATESLRESIIVNRQTTDDTVKETRSYIEKKTGSKLTKAVVDEDRP